MTSEDERALRLWRTLPNGRGPPLLELADENDMTGTPQFIKPYADFWAGESQRTFVLACHARHCEVLVPHCRALSDQPVKPRKVAIP